MVVYGDLYFLLNAVVDFVLLYVAGRVARVQSPAWRLAVAAGAGAAYALAQLWWPNSLAYGAFGRVAAVPALIAIAFAPVAARRFAVLCVSLLGAAVALAGATLAVTLAAEAHRPLWSAMSARAWGIPWWALALSLAAAAAAAAALHRRRAAVAHRQWLVPLAVRVEDRVAHCTALIDTGNRLRDPLGAGPVVVMEARALAEALPERVTDLLAAGSEGSASLEDVATALEGTAWAARFRIVPFQGLGVRSGLLLGFRPDGVEVEGRRCAAPATVGVCTRRLDPDDAYRALIPAALASEPSERLAASAPSAPLGDREAS